MDKNCPLALRTLEMVFQSIKISNFSWGKCAQIPLVAHPFGACVIPQ